MIRSIYVPDRGDLVWISFNPTAGHEQSGRRPALVLTPRIYNLKTGLCVVCPGTLKEKGYAFEVVTIAPDGKRSVILSDHLRNVDWRARSAEFMYRVSDEELSAVCAQIAALIVSPDL